MAYWLSLVFAEIVEMLMHSILYWQMSLELFQIVWAEIHLVIRMNQSDWSPYFQM